MLHSSAPISKRSFDTSGSLIACAGHGSADDGVIVILCPIRSLMLLLWFLCGEGGYPVSEYHSGTLFKVKWLCDVL